MLDKQTAQALMLGIVTMQLTKGVDWTVERNIKITIGVFYVALMACMGSFFYVRYEIKKKSDTREVRIMGDGYEERMSVQSYDTKHVKGQMKMFLIGTGLVFMLYVGFGYIPVLAIHSIFVIVTYVQDPLFQIHLFKRKDVGKLARPFGSSAVFHTDAKVKEVNSKDEMTMALKNAGSKLVVMDFYAEWCNPCRKIAPEVERLAENNLDVIFLRANVDKSKELLKQYKVSSLPHFVFIKNHKELDTVIGASKTKLESTLEKLVKETKE